MFSRKRKGRHKASRKEQLKVEDNSISTEVKESAKDASTEISLTPKPLPQKSSFHYIAEEVSISDDEFSRKIYLLLSLKNATDDEFSNMTELLDKRNEIFNRLKVLNEHIVKLSNDAAARQAEFEDMKFNIHMTQVEALPELDDDESNKESLDDYDEIPKKREDLKNILLLLARLEYSRAERVRPYLDVLYEISEALPEGVDFELEREINTVLNNEIINNSNVDNHAISDGEFLSSEKEDASIKQIESFLDELKKEENSELVKFNGESKFSI